MQSLKALLLSQATVTSVLFLRWRHGSTPRNYRKLSDVGQQDKQTQGCKNSMCLDLPWVLRAKPDLSYWVVFEIIDTHNHIQLAAIP
jgi:hypothetical protein